MKANNVSSMDTDGKFSWVNSTAIRQYWPIAVLLVVATVLYLFQLGVAEFGTDELYSIYDAQNLKLISARPLYFALLKGWMVFGTGEAWLRGLGVVFGLASLVLIYLLGRRLAGNAVALMATVMMVISPLIINHVQEVRMYALGNCLSIAATLALTYALEKPTARSITTWAVLRLLMLLAIPLSFTLLVADGVLVLITFRDRLKSILPFLAAAITVSLLWLPFALALVTAKEGYDDAWGTETVAPSVMELVRKFKFFTVWPFRVQSNPLIAHAFRLLTFILVGLTCFGLFKKHRSPHLLWTATWAFLPMALLFLVSSVSTSVLLDRYVMFTVPYFFILIAAGLERIYNLQRLFGIALAIAYLAAASSGLWEHYQSRIIQTNWKGAVQTIAENVQPGDSIAVSIPHGRICPFISYYYQGDAPVYHLEAFKGKIAPETVRDILKAMPVTDSRVWLLYRNARGEGRYQMFPQVVSEQFDVESQESFKGGLILLLLNSGASEPSDVQPVLENCNG